MHEAIAIVALYLICFTLQIVIDKMTGWHLYAMFTNNNEE